VAWVETDSLSFIARHEDDDTEFAHRTLDALEELRLRLEDRFEIVPGDVTVIIHPHPGWLAAAHPYLPVARLAAAPAGRRYLAGWAMSTELHVLNGRDLEKRAAGSDSLAALLGTAERQYTQLVIGANNPKLPPPWGPRRFLRYLRMTWLVEGAAQYYSGQVPLFRAAVKARLRNGGRPSFPPSPRDAILLGGTIFELLERERGRDACDVLIGRIGRRGARGNLERAFNKRLRHIEADWRSFLEEDDLILPELEGLLGDL